MKHTIAWILAIVAFIGAGYIALYIAIEAFNVDDDATLLFVGAAVGVVAAVGVYKLTIFMSADRLVDVASRTSKTFSESREKIADRMSDDADFDAYAVAEDEVNAGNMDKGLWSKALVEAKGDEQQRKVAYMELRAAQIAKQKRAKRSER